MELIGRIKKIGETKEYGANGFRKRELVIVTEEQYPQFVPIEFIQDKTSLLDAFAEGQQVKVSYNIRGREWISPEGEARYFVSLAGWKVEKLEAVAPGVNPQTPPAPSAPPTPSAPDNMETMEPGTQDSQVEDDLPF